jgi:serine/threonine protein kinase
MSHINYQRGEEPVPGVVLDNYLGRGGFGEVWKATGPGGVPVAIKVIYDLDRKKGGRELKALRLLKNIRHPNLVPLTGFWLRSGDGRLLADESAFPDANASASVNGPSSASDAARGTMVVDVEPVKLDRSQEVVELIIAMGLCEESLFDRLESCRKEGVQGLPIEELLTYMDDAARAIDLLNVKHDIQHCDIKPQNILLLSGAAQVADFGLAKMIGDVRESSMGAGTIAYGAPEVLLGAGPSSSTDHYSLAISYYELRTGQLPFGSDSISEVLNAKQGGSIDLNRLPPSERKVITKASSLKPSDRYGNCQGMVRALRECRAARGAFPVKDSSSRRPSPRLITAAALVTLALLAIGGAAVLAPSGPKKLDGGSTVDATSERLEVEPKAAWHNSADLPKTSVRSNENKYESDVDDKRIATGGKGQEPAESDQKASATGFELENDSKDERTTVQSASTESEVTANIGGKGVRQAAERMDSVGDDGTPQTTDEPVEVSSAIEQATRATADNTRQIAETTERISLSLAAIRAELAESFDRSGLIDDPHSPSDFYHNAKMYEERGDYSNARRCYLRLLSFRLDVLDPHLRFQRVLRIQEGRSAAREVYSDLDASQDTMATTFATLLLLPDTQRVAALTRFLKSRQDYAPAVYYQSLEFSKGRLGVQGLADIAEERRLLEQFERMVDDGKLLRHFLDQSHAITMIDEGRTRLTAAKQIDPATLRTPVHLTAMMSNTSWMVNLSIAEATREILYRTNEDQPFESTGVTSHVDQRTGKPMPLPAFQLPLDSGRTDIWVKYTLALQKKSAMPPSKDYEGYATRVL